MNQNNQRPQLAQVMNATIVTGEYLDKQGQQKKSYLTIGTLFIYQDGGMSMKLDAMPTNGQNINFYPRKTKEHNQPVPQQPQNYNPNGQQNHGGHGQNQGYQGQ